MAVDLGTTTISVQFSTWQIQRSSPRRNGYNDQIHCGLDVISRINYARTPERLEDLSQAAVHSINRLIREAAARATCQKRTSPAAVVSGNTVMTHLLLGLNPEYIRLEPYTPTVLRCPVLHRRRAGHRYPSQCARLPFPCSGQLCRRRYHRRHPLTDLAKGKEEISLFIDIGTNGEIVLGNGDFLMTCACSAGPGL